MILRSSSAVHGENAAFPLLPQIFAHLRKMLLHMLHPRTPAAIAIKGNGLLRPVVVTELLVCRDIFEGGELDRSVLGTRVPFDVRIAAVVVQQAESAGNAFRATMLTPVEQVFIEEGLFTAFDFLMADDNGRTHFNDFPFADRFI